jgi:Na+/proline symporter
MSETLVISIITCYFLALIGISLMTSRHADTNTFFTANRQSPWYLVAYGMLGASISGVTFISVPGGVGSGAFGYFQVVLGYWAGYMVVITVLLPLYYKLNLVSIYGYLEQRFSFWSYKTGASFFLLSRTVGSAIRLYLAANVLDLFLFRNYGIPFGVTVAITIVLIWVYTFRGGIKTIVWTDTFQTTFLIAAVIVSVVTIASQLNFSLRDVAGAIQQAGFDKIFFFEDPNSRGYFFKQFIGGAFITITMTGLDQEIMQKNLTCKTLFDAQKNMFWFSLLLVIINLLFLTLGALLFIYAENKGIPLPASSDDLYPLLAFKYLGLLTGIFFLLGITASSYASGDSALAGLTTSFCFDFLNFKERPEQQKRRLKFIVHIGFSLLFLLIILIFRELNERSVIDAVLSVAGYTYGPLLGLFAFGIFTRRMVFDSLVPVVCLISPAISFALSSYSLQLFNGYQFGYEIVLVNGLITFSGLWLISHSPKKEKAVSE